MPHPRPKKSARSDSGSADRGTRWKFGQNFLVDDTVVRAICDDLPSSPADWIIEIGPGQGALTRRLLPRCRKLTALEIDRNWAERLRARSEPNLEVLQADATRVDWEEIFARHAPEPGQKPLVIGNLPYNRAAPILLRLLPHLRRCLSAQFMFQLEVAKRLCARPHSRDFSFLTVAAQNHARAELLRKIPPDAFRPRPKVWSATVRLTPREAPASSDPQFLPFVDLAFSQRRKKMANVLGPFYAKEKIREALEALALNPEGRAEDVSVEGFAGLFAKLGPVARS